MLLVVSETTKDLQSCCISHLSFKCQHRSRFDSGTKFLAPSLSLVLSCVNKRGLPILARSGMSVDRSDRQRIKRHSCPHCQCVAPGLGDHIALPPAYRRTLLPQNPVLVWFAGTLEISWIAGNNEATRTGGGVQTKEGNGGGFGWHACAQPCRCMVSSTTVKAGPDALMLEA
jgi:hypothetical protein